MENNKPKLISFESSLCTLFFNYIIVCFEYKLNQSYDNNNFNFVNDFNSMISNRNNSQQSINLQFSNNNNNTIINDEDDFNVNEKRNYDESELFSYSNANVFRTKCSNISKAKPSSLDIDFNIHNNLNFPMDYMSNAIIANNNNYHENSGIDFQHTIFPKTNEVQHLPSGENQDEEDKLVFHFVQTTDNKTKQQLVKKLVSIYKKRKYDEEKTNAYCNKLALGIGKPIAEVKNRLESILTSICKEITKLMLTIQMHKLPLTTSDWNNLDAKFLKQVITGKIKEYLDRVIEEEHCINNNLFLNKYLETYAPTKSKKKSNQGFFKDRLIKRIKEIFEKSQMTITEERIIVLFFPAANLFTNDIMEKNDINGNMNMTSNLNSTIDRMTMNNYTGNSIKENDEYRNIMDMKNSFNNKPNMQLDLPSANNCIEHFVSASHLKLINKSPKMSFKYKIKQYEQEDFL